jgi:nucleoside-diphosphate-sugar epimerase
MTHRVLLTGGAGFVGSHLTRACLKEGWKVGVIYQPQAGFSQLEDVRTQINSYPVNGTTENILSIVEEFQPELVFHLASIFLVQHAPRDIPTLIDSNITFGVQLLEAMAKSRSPYLVNAGTSWQHYQNSDYNPVNLYAATKQAFEDILEYYVQAYRIRAITLKLYDTFGPADPRPKLINVLRHSAKEKSRLDMSPGDQLIDLVYIDDVVNAFMVSARRLFDDKVVSHERFAVSSGKPVRLRDLVAIYERVSGQSLDISWGGRPYREREVMKPWSHGKRLPGWRPMVDLVEGIRKTLEQKNES